MTEAATAAVTTTMRPALRRAATFFTILFDSGCESRQPTSAPPDASHDAPSPDARDADEADHHAPDVVVPGDAATPVVLPRCPSGVAMPYPDSSEISLLASLPSLTFPDASGASIPLSRYYTPCASAPRLLVIRVLAAWSGPARHHVEHTRRLSENPQAARVDLLDLLALNAQNLPPTPSDLTAWRARYDVDPGMLAADPGYRMRALFLGAGKLPMVLLVDPRTMTITRLLDAPDTHDIAWEISAALARLDGQSPPAHPQQPLYDGRLVPDAWEMVQAMSPVPAPPADPTNAMADNADAAALGRALFSDPRLSRSGMTSCATCHMPNFGFADRRPVAIAAATGDRNTPAIVFSAHNRWQFWDGRADSLWAQALGPIENPGEMNGSRLAVAHHVADTYAASYTRLFGALPPLDVAARFPAEGRPGTPAWEAMTDADRTAVTRVYVNVGKSIAAFERTLRMGPSALDAYAAGDVNAMTPEARDGLRRFIENGCLQCHYGPTLTDDSFHNIRFPTGRADGQPDVGRIDGVRALLESPFRADGAFSDAPTANTHLARLAVTEAMRGQFHTPTLRGVSATGPWGHGGTVTTMVEVMRHYAQITMRPTAGTVGDLDLHVGDFHSDAATLQSFVALMEAMNAPIIAP